MSLGINTRITDTREQPSTLGRGNTLYVGGTGEGNYSSIQDAIDNASDEDTVFVYDDSSPYYELLVIDKSISLIGEDRDRTVIDGGYKANVVSIFVDWVYISGFTIQNSGDGWDDKGIDIVSSNNTITGNTISNNDYGIWLGDYSDSNIITGNTFSSNKWDGVCQGEYTNSNIINGHTITDNKFLNNHLGICLKSSNNTIAGNTFNSNVGAAIAIGYGCNNTITDNIISNSYADGIVLYDNNGNNITNNTIINTKNGHGISLDERSSGNSITNNKIWNNYDNGIFLVECDNNAITGNSIVNNYVGIYLAGSSNNIITGNTISNNPWAGICLYVSNYNIIYHNNFLIQNLNAYDMGENTWDDGNYGNYWLDYRFKYPFARRIWSKGIWDTPYEIYGGSSKDRCPLIKQWPNSLSRTMPRNRAMTNLLLLRFLEQFPILEKLFSFIF